MINKLDLPPSQITENQPSEDKNQGKKTIVATQSGFLVSRAESDKTSKYFTNDGDVKLQKNVEVFERQDSQDSGVDCGADSDADSVESLKNLRNLETPEILTEADIVHMQSLIVDKTLEILSTTFPGVEMPESEEAILTSAVPLLKAYFAQEGVDFSALSDKAQSKAVEHFAAMPVVTILEAMGIQLTVAEKVAGHGLTFEELQVEGLAMQPEQPTQVLIEEDLSLLENVSELSDQEWDDSIDLLTRKAIELAGIDTAAYDDLPTEQQEEIYHEGFEQFLSFSGRKDLSSLSGSEYIALVRQYAEPSLSAAPENVEYVETQVSAPVVEEVAIQSTPKKQHKAKKIAKKKIPDIFVSGSSAPIELNKSTQETLTKKYHDDISWADELGNHEFQSEFLATANKAKPENAGLKGGIWRLFGRK